MNIGRTQIKVFAILTVVLILVAGLHPKDFKITGSVTTDSESGLTGAKYALAATDVFLPADLISRLNNKGFGIEMAFIPPEEWPNYFMAIATITTGNASDQFLIGQWRDTLIIMTGDDYQNKSRKPRLQVNLSDIRNNNSDQGTIKLKLQFSVNAGTAFFKDKPISSNPAFRGVLPGGIDHDDSASKSQQSSSKKAFVTLTNTAARNQAWLGSLARFELLETGVEKNESVVKYDFTKLPAKTETQLDNADIALLANFQVRGTQFLNYSTNYFETGRGSLVDIPLNIAGFIPFGLLGLLLLSKHASAIVSFTISCLAGSSLSLIIEITQGILPSRHSTIFDWMFNSLGTLLGALLGLLILWLKFLRDSRQASGKEATKEKLQ